MSPRRLAWALVATGCSLVVIGVAAISPVLALILAGTGVAALGLLAVDVDRKVRP